MTTLDARWCVYAIRCADGSLYLGMSNDVIARVAAHDAGRGARFTRGRRPVRLVWWWQTADASSARRLEALLKRLRRAERLRLVNGDSRVLLPVLVEARQRGATRRGRP